jgi:hypothetical protein
MADRLVDVRPRGQPNSHGKLVKVLDRVQGRVGISLLIGEFDLSVSIKDHDRSLHKAYFNLELVRDQTSTLRHPLV